MERFLQPANFALCILDCSFLIYPTSCEIFLVSPLLSPWYWWGEGGGKDSKLHTDQWLLHPLVISVWHETLIIHNKSVIKEKASMAPFSCIEGKGHFLYASQRFLKVLISFSHFYGRRSCYWQQTIQKGRRWCFKMVFFVCIKWRVTICMLNQNICLRSHSTFVIPVPLHL